MCASSHQLAARARSDYSSRHDIRHRRGPVRGSEDHPLGLLNRPTSSCCADMLLVRASGIQCANWTRSVVADIEARSVARSAVPGARRAGRAILGDMGPMDRLWRAVEAEPRRALEDGLSPTDLQSLLLAVARARAGC
jgi:hypothetical protein